jgi:hypothetical protein
MSGRVPLPYPLTTRSDAAETADQRLASAAGPFQHRQHLAGAGPAEDGGSPVSAAGWAQRRFGMKSRHVHCYSPQCLRISRLPLRSIRIVPSEFQLSAQPAPADGPTRPFNGFAIGSDAHSCSVDTGAARRATVLGGRSGRSAIASLSEAVELACRVRQGIAYVIVAIGHAEPDRS